MAELDLLGLMRGAAAATAAGIAPERIDGVALGVITNTEDPDRLGRVKVQLPWLSPCVESPWARVAVPSAGANRGSYLPPEVGDDALVAFQHGDVRFPFVVGFLWSEKAPPPQRSRKPVIRELRSVKGHRIVLDDSDAETKLTIHSQSGHEITLDDKQNEIAITTAGGKITVSLDGETGSVKITAGQDLALDAPNGKVSITGFEIDVHAQSELKLDGDTAVRIACSR